MPKKPEIKDDVTQEVLKPGLRPFTVFINGEDRTVFATGEQDLQEKVAKLRAA